MNALEHVLAVFADIETAVTDLAESEPDRKAVERARKKADRNRKKIAQLMADPYCRAPLKILRVR